MRSFIFFPRRVVVESMSFCFRTFYNVLDSLSLSLFWGAEALVVCVGISAWEDGDDDGMAMMGGRILF